MGKAGRHKGCEMARCKNSKPLELLVLANGDPAMKKPTATTPRKGHLRLEAPTQLCRRRFSSFSPQTGLPASRSGVLAQAGRGAGSGGAPSSPGRASPRPGPVPPAPS